LQSKYLHHPLPPCTPRCKLLPHKDLKKPHKIVGFFA
jgi:hypothetical protein